MSYSVLESYRKHYVSDKVRLKRLKKEAKKRNCSVILHKASIPLHDSCKSEDDQKVPIFTEEAVPELLSSTNECEFPPDTDYGTRNIFQSINSISILEKSSKSHSVPVDSLLLIDLGSACNSIKQDEEPENTNDEETEKNNDEVNNVSKFGKEFQVKELQNEGTTGKLDNWCPLTPLSESERDTFTPNESDDDDVSNCENIIPKMPLIKECWSLAEKDSIWSYSTRDGSQHSTSNSIENNSDSVLVSVNCDVTENSFNSEIQNCREGTPELISHQIDIQDLPEAFPTKMPSVNEECSHCQNEKVNGCTDVNSSSTVPTNTKQAEDEISEFIVFENGKLNELQTDSQNQSMDVEDNYYKIQQETSTCVDAGNAVDMANNNCEIVDNHYETEDKEYTSSVHQLLTDLVDNIVNSEKTVRMPESLPFNSSSPDINSVEAQKESQDTVADSNKVIIVNTQQNMDDYGESYRENVKNTSLNKLHTREMSKVNQTNLLIPMKSKRGRPRKRGNKYRKSGPLVFDSQISYQCHDKIYNMNNLNSLNNRNNIPKVPSHQMVNVPIELPSKGIIGMVSPETFNEIQKHKSASDHMISETSNQSQLSHNPQTVGLYRGAFVPIYSPMGMGQKTVHSEMINNTSRPIVSSVQIQQNNINGSHSMIELQRPPPTYQSTIQSSVQHAVDVGSESVLALPPNAMSNMPVPISIPKCKSHRNGLHGKVTKPKLTVREQLLQKMRGKISGRLSNQFTQQMPSNIGGTPTTKFHTVQFQKQYPNQTIPASMPQLVPLPQHTHGLQSMPQLEPLPQHTHSLPVSMPPLKQRPKENQTSIAPSSFSQILEPMRPAHVHQFKIPTSISAESPPQQQHPCADIRDGIPLNYLTHSLNSQNCKKYSIYNTSKTSKSRESIALASQCRFEDNLQPRVSNQMSQVVTSQPTVICDPENLSKVAASQQDNCTLDNNVVGYNASNTQKKIPHPSLFENVNAQLEFNIPLDLSMPSRKVHPTIQNIADPQPEINLLPLDLSMKSVLFSAVTPLDLSKKEHYINEAKSECITPSPMQPTQKSHESISTFQPDQNLSVLAAAAEMLESKTSTTTSNVPPHCPSPKLTTKLRVKFNPKRKLWHLVPNRDSQKHFSKKQRRGRPPLAKTVKERQRHSGETLICQFCSFTHTQKSEVRLHIKLAHFAKFRKDPKTNNLRNIGNSPNNTNLNESTESDAQLPLTGNANIFPCKSCDFKATAKYLLQRHVIKWHPNKTFYTCQSKDCGEIFQTTELLDEHQLIHKMNQKYVCKICGARYHYLNGLRAHEARHHSSLAFQCSNCGLKFKSQGTLHRHQLQKSHFSVDETPANN